MSLFEGITRMGRRQAEALMGSVCVISRKTGTTRDQTTGKDVDTFATVYEGKCRVSFRDARGDGVGAGDQAFDRQNPTLSLPVDAVGSADVRTNDVAVITANPLDAGLVGVRFRVAGIHALTQGTARRLPVEVLS